MLGKQAHCYEIFEKLDPPPPKKEKEDLRAYTKANTKQSKDEETVYGDWRTTVG